jgi:hypothetical protein
MYLRQSNKWNEYLLQEAIEDIGLPPVIVYYLRQQNEAFGPIENKHLTWLGQLVKRSRTDLLLPRDDLGEIRLQLVQAVRTTLKKRGGREDMEVFNELYDEAVAPLIEYRQAVQGISPNIADIKKFKKSMMKNLRRLEISPQFIKGFDSYTDTRMRKGVAEVLMGSIKPIMLLLAEDPASYNDLREQPALRGAGSVAQEILDNPPKAEDQVIHEFDNGYFWYDIQSNVCDLEAKRMKHCGRGEDAQLYSLRVGEKRNVKPMVTVEFDGSTVYQIKGKGNQSPSRDLWTYIDWFLENMDVDKITERGKHSSDAQGFAEMLEYLEEKHPDLNWGSTWIKEATELLGQWEGSIEQDSQTDLELDWPGGEDDVQEVGIVLRHQAFWPIKDVVVEEDTGILLWEIMQDAEEFAKDILYPNPVSTTAEVFRKGEQDSRAAMLRIDLVWMEGFQPDGDEEEVVQRELERLGNYLEEMSEISGYLVDQQSHEEFDYNEWWTKIEKQLEDLGVYRDIAGEIDAEDERDRSPQLELPLQEQRIMRHWQQIIK